MRYDNEIGASGVVAGLMIFIIIIVGVMGIFSISSEFENQYNTTDKLNTTGIYTNGTAPYNVTTSLTKAFLDSTPGAILLALLLAIVLIVMAVWAIVKKGGE